MSDFKFTKPSELTKGARLFKVSYDDADRPGRVREVTLTSDLQKTSLFGIPVFDVEEALDGPGSANGEIRTRYDILTPESCGYQEDSFGLLELKDESMNRLFSSKDEAVRYANSDQFKALAQRHGKSLVASDLDLPVYILPKVPEMDADLKETIGNLFPLDYPDKPDVIGLETGGNSEVLNRILSEVQEDMDKDRDRKTGRDASGPAI